MSTEFDRMCQERHIAGAEQYGAFKFLEVDTLDMLAEELFDIANYARFTFIKVRLLQAQLAHHAAGVDTDTKSMLGQLDYEPGGVDDRMSSRYGE